MSPISEFTNEIYDQDSLSDAFKEGADIYTIFLGVVVTLLPKVTRPLEVLIQGRDCSI